MGIDYGTGGAKACIIDAEGNVLGFVFEEYSDNGGYDFSDAHIKANGLRNIGAFEQF